jgi:hypothetical protein
MAKRRHTTEQIIAKLREAEVALAKGQPLATLCRLGTGASSWLWVVCSCCRG